MKIQKWLLAILLTVTLSMAQASLITISAPEADTYLRENQATTKFGSDTQMLVGDLGFNSSFHGLARFDLSSIQALGTLGVDYNINSVSLTGTRTSAGQNSLNIILYEYGFDFVEANATWNDPDGDGSGATGDTSVGGTFGTQLTSQTADTSDVTVTLPDSEAFRAAISGALSEGHINFLLASEDDGSGGSSDFFRFQQNDGSNTSPLALSVDYTVIPEPATMSLLGLSGVTILLLRRLRKN